MKFKCFKIISLLVQFFIDIPHLNGAKHSSSIHILQGVLSLGRTNFILLEYNHFMSALAV